MTNSLSIQPTDTQLAETKIPEANAILLVAMVTSPDMLRRLTHVVRLLELNEHPDSAESIQLLIDLASPKEEEPAE